MEIYIADQLRLFCGSVVLGLCMGLLYDLMRAFRLRFPVVGSALDAACCLLCAAAVFLYVLRSGGALRLYILLGCVLGCVLFFCAFSQLLRPLWALWVDALLVFVQGLLFPLRVGWKLCKKIAGHAKNLFLFCRKWVTIWNYKWTVIRIHRERGTARVKEKEAARKKKPRSSALTKVLILTLLLVLGVQLYRLHGQIQIAEAEYAQLDAQVEQVRQKNAALAQDIENGDNQELLEKLAREKLELLLPGEKVFVEVSN